MAKRYAGINVKIVAKLNREVSMVKVLSSFLVALVAIVSIICFRKDMFWRANDRFYGIRQER